MVYYIKFHRKIQAIFRILCCPIFKRYIALLLIFVGIGFLWNTVFVYPLKIFVVFMHEVSHGLAAIATGGRIVEIQINPQQGGVRTDTRRLPVFDVDRGLSR